MTRNAPGGPQQTDAARAAAEAALAARAALLGQRGGLVWFTGLPGSGKTTLARALEAELLARGRPTIVLDGDELRRGLCADLGYSDADRAENLRRVAEVGRLLVDACYVVLVACVSPTEGPRARAREVLGPERFRLVHVATPLAVCEARDPKGLYARAAAGELPGLTGVSAPYEVPTTPDLVLDTSALELEDARARLEQLVDPFTRPRGARPPACDQP